MAPKHLLYVPVAVRATRTAHNNQKRKSCRMIQVQRLDGEKAKERKQEKLKTKTCHNRLGVLQLIHQVVNVDCCRHAKDEAEQEDVPRRFD